MGNHRRLGRIALVVVLVVIGLSATASFIDFFSARDEERSLGPSAQAVRQLEKMRAEVIGRVESIRGLEARADIPVRYVDPQQSLAELMAGLEDEDVEEIEADADLLTRLGLLPPDLDVMSTFESFLESGVAGYYRPDYGDVALVYHERQPEVIVRWTLAHEYVHALQDQHFDITETSEAAAKGDARAAVSALTEGDATFLMVAIALGDALGDSPDFAQQTGLPEDEAVLAALPSILQRELLFPYFDGLNFAQRMWGRGGWSSVDETWLAPPTSTEQIMHPERYPDEQPILVGLPDVAQALGDGWASRYETTMGELRASVLVAADEPWEIPEFPLVGMTLPNAAAAAGWGGDSIVTLDGPDESWAVVWQTTWDTAKDADEFAAAAGGAGLAKVPGEYVVMVGTDIAAAAPAEQGVLILTADSAATLDALREALALA